MQPKQEDKEFNAKPNFPEMEEQVLKFWEEREIFAKSLEQTKDGQPFVFFEGPPTANGKPGIHHVEARAFKDLIPRYQTMRGKYVLRRAGWDTHGLPVELQVEKTLGISGKKQIESIRPTVKESIIEFNRLSKQSVWKYKEEWENLTQRMGFWVDMKNPYVTYHNKFIESVWAILKQAWDKDLVYLGHKVVPYCTRCGTPLSSHEVAQGYETVKDNSVFVKFKLKDELPGVEGETYVLSWTTTPWTLPGNVALAVGKEIEYSVAKTDSGNYIFAKALTERIQKVFNDVVLEEIKTIKGSELVGLSYEPLFKVASLEKTESYKIYYADFVTTTDGTGVVHTAVMYGEDDYKLGEIVGLPKFHTVDDAGKFISEVEGLAGMYVKADKTEKQIFEILQKNGNLLAIEPYEHEYPHCWRCGTPLIYYARNSWFIKMSSLREDLIKNNEQITWNPSHIKYGRFGEWLSEVKDWAISRERYWGTPLPIWHCKDCNHHQIIGKVEDLHLHENRYLLARHGESDSVVQGIHVNWPEPVPIHLTDLGKSQAHSMAERIKKDGGVDLIFASDLNRTKETAEIISKVVGVEVIYDERLREYNLGVLNGHKLSEFHESFAPSKRWQEAPEGGETYMQLQNRMMDFVSEVNAKHNGKRILVITHGDVIWLLNQFYDLDNHYPQVGEYSEMDISLTDLHRPYIDEVKLKCEKCGGEAERVKDVMDVWFDSGAMPYAQWHYPFEHKELAEAQFPADFISEAIDQTRGWFYTLLAISTILGKGPAFKHVISLGHLLDEKGRKMSKSKGNVVDPWTVMNKQGVDSLRWYMYSVNQPGDTKLFAERELDMIVRKNFLTLWNVLSFFVTYSKFDNWEAGKSHKSVSDVLDKWILTKTKELVNEVTTGLDNYDAFKPTRKIEEFINELSTWYVRRSRERKGPDVYQTLYEVLKTMSLLLAPFTPFLAESIWSVLRLESDPESVHLAKWPEASAPSAEEKLLLDSMEAIREAANVALGLRKTSGHAIRQPLARLSVIPKEKVVLSPELLAILTNEINVKVVEDVAVSEKVVSAPGTRLISEVRLDTELTKELKLEGLARNLERLVQDKRKSTGLKVGEMVKLSYDTDDKDVTEAMGIFDKKKTFVAEIKAEKIAGMEPVEIDGKSVGLSIQK